MEHQLSEELVVNFEFSQMYNHKLNFSHLFYGQWWRILIKILGLFSEFCKYGYLSSLKIWRMLMIKGQRLWQVCIFERYNHYHSTVALHSLMLVSRSLSSFSACCFLTRVKGEIPLGGENENHNLKPHLTPGSRNAIEISNPALWVDLFNFFVLITNNNMKVGTPLDATDHLFICSDLSHN